MTNQIFTNGVAYKNHSMIDELSLSDIDKTLRRFRTREVNCCYAPVGHVYSVMVELLNIKEPNISEFIYELNRYIQEFDRFMCIHSPSEKLYSLTTRVLDQMLHETLTKRKYRKYGHRIIKEAVGGYERD